MKKITASLQKLEAVSTKTGKNSRQANMRVSSSYDILGKEIKRVVILTDKFGNSSRHVVKEVKGWEAQMNSLRWKMVNFAFVFGSISQIASPFVKLTKEALAFEHQLAKVTAVTGVAEQDIKDIVTATREGTPFTIQETTDAFLEFAKAGFSAKESAEALKNILDLSLISNQTLAQASSRTAQIIKQFGLSASDSENITAILSSTADTTRASVEGLGNALAYAGAIAGAAGQSFEGTVFALGLLTDAGLDNQKSGTALRQIVSALIDPSKKAQTAMNKLGISLSTASGEIKETTDFMEELYDSIKHMTAAEQQSILGEMFSVRALAGVEIFIKQIKEADGSLDDFKDKTQAVGTTLLKSWTFANTQLSEFKDVWNTFKTTLIKDGPELSNTINAFGESLQRIAPYIKAIIDYSAFLFEGFSRAAGAIILLATGVGLVAVGLGGGVWVAVGAALLAIASGATIAQVKAKFFGETVEDYSKSTSENISKANSVLLTHVEGYGALSSAIKDTPGVIDIFNNKLAGSGDTLAYMTQNVASLETELLYLENQLKDTASDPKRLNQLSADILRVGEALIESKQSLVAWSKSMSINGESILDNVKNTNQLILGYNRFNSAVQNLKKSADTDEAMFDKLTGRDSIHKVSGELSGFISKYKILYDTIDSISGLYPAQGEYVNDIKDTIQKILENNDAIEDTEKKIYDLTLAKEFLTTKVAMLKKELDEEQASLKSLQTEYKETEARIKSLAKARFKDESATMSLLQKAEIFQKKNELAALGVADAQQFITDAVADSGTEYDKYFEKITKINGAMDDNQRTFKSWEQTIKSSIKAEVEAGQELEKDVSGRVKTWQTALLGISEFSDSGSSGGPLDDFINKLQLASDVHFGGMRGDVESFTRQKEDEQSLLTAESSAQLIQAMQKEYDTRAILSAQISSKQSVVDAAADAHKKKVEELNDVIDDITASKTEIDAYVLSIENITLKVDEFGKTIAEALDIINKEIGKDLRQTVTFGSGQQMSGDFFGGSPLYPQSGMPNYAPSANGSGQQMSGDFFGGSPLYPQSVMPNYAPSANVTINATQNSSSMYNDDDLAPSIQDYLTSLGYTTNTSSQ